ncbi:hypothetical protein [Marinifilum caeruleilacunae]|uniref:Uncharacterized protein n=1 Tax=Marinifilum caeruleilacunae TaxID=2499076 RepID=A0ABX1WQT5_9BACT|nr:hypothetical protein [Marinifilum caeruleilacunae]NOU58453.1 hypothetical protein [Marinifilum caeruleilacunae]
MIEPGPKKKQNSRPTFKQFYQSEHWSLKILYMFAGVCFLINFYYIMSNEPVENKFFGIAAYATMAFFAFRYEFACKKEKSAKEKILE